MQQTHRIARHEAVGVEEILLEPEARETPLEVAVSVARHAVAQDQVLCAGGRTDRIGLHETRRDRRARERGRRRQRRQHRPSAQCVDGELIGHSVQRAGQHLVHALDRPAQADAAWTDDHRALHQDRMRQHRIDERRVGHGRIAQAERGHRGATPTQQLARRQPHPPQQIEQFRAAGGRLQVFDHARLHTGVADRRAPCVT